MFQNTFNNQSLTLFPFQVPTLGDAELGEALSVDWQNMAMYHYKEGSWKYKMHIKGNRS